MLNISIVVGNPKPASRTRLVAERLVQRLVPVGAEVRTIDLVEHRAELFEWPGEAVAELAAAVAASDLAVFASPTYKASYTGLLKAFLDRYQSGGLRGVVAVPVMTGADATHALGGEAHLVPLLVELGASVPTRSLYFVTGDMDALDAALDDWVADAVDALERAANVASAIAAPAVAR